MKGKVTIVKAENGQKMSCLRALHTDTEYRVVKPDEAEIMRDDKLRLTTRTIRNNKRVRSDGRDP